ncbi:MAG TPA: PEP-CTERM sorting domain-containing protein, partial [Bryobacteraceae bacterium]
TLTSVNADTVMVKETLASGEVFAVSGAGKSLAFNIDEAFTIVAGSLTSGFTSGSSTSSSPFGSFSSFVDCTSTTVCGNGTSPPTFSGPLSFEVFNAAGLTPSDFISNGTAFFASDIGVPKTGGGFNTGNVASDSGVSLAPPPSTPEPSTMILLGLGSFAMFVVKKRSSRSS